MSFIPKKTKFLEFEPEGPKTKFLGFEPE